MDLDLRDDRYGDQIYGASFASNGRLATTSLDGRIRLYAYNLSGSPSFRAVVQPMLGPSGNRPFGIAFSPDGNRLAVGYADVVAVDVLDGSTLRRVGGHIPDATPSPFGSGSLAWSRDGQTLYAAGAMNDAQGQRLLLIWDRGGLGGERRLSYCAPDSAIGINTLTDGQILVGSMSPCLGLMEGDGKPVWTIASPLADFRSQPDALRVSADGTVVDFVFGDPSKALIDPAEAKLRFDCGRSLC